MPMKSQAQRSAMHAAKSGKSTLGIPKDVGTAFVSHDTGGKLPKKVKKRSKYAPVKNKKERARSSGWQGRY